MTTEQIQLNNLKENAKEKIDSLKNDVYDLCNVLKYQDTSKISKINHTTKHFINYFHPIKLL
jgi:hypothetical protein